MRSTTQSDHIRALNRLCHAKRQTLNIGAKHAEHQAQILGRQVFCQLRGETKVAQAALSFIQWLIPLWKPTALLSPASPNSPSPARLRKGDIKRLGWSWTTRVAEIQFGRMRAQPRG